MEWKLPKGVLASMNCPKCNSLDVAEIFWGYPGNLDSMKEKLDKVSDADKNPFFECTHCGFMTMYEVDLKTHRLIHYI